jgi:hypothetical protein
MVASALPNKPSKTNFNQLMIPLKTIYDLLDSPAARENFELSILKQLRSLE